ncbi:tetratricopeptide repeat-containing sensor histidine kinase [Flavobacterium palustre]|uniref:tetratricopeptide repeat-containing sensor histidine kinase n=1 Tax=Flavobacterium palustre TaxID=1476463 RepID=UPI0016678397|nr:ATP-binding protein [Flavobacterium palustre]
MNFHRFYSKLTILVIAILATSLLSCEKKKKTAEGSTYKPQQVDKYFKLANQFYDNSKYDSAFYYATKIKLIINPEKDLEKYTTTMFILITSQQLQGDYSGAESSIVETLSNVEKEKSERYKYKFYTMLGYNYTCQSNYNEALFYYKKALSFKVPKKRKLISIINIGNIYKQKKQFKKAIKILEPLLSDKNAKQNKYYYAGILNDLGFCYFKTGNPKAIIYLNQSLKMNYNMDSTADDDYDLTTNYYSLYHYYLKKDKTKAINFAKLLYKKGTQYNNPDDRLLALNFLIKNSTGEELKKYSLNYINLNDSITKVRQKAKNYFAKLKYDSKKEKEENLKLKAEKELQQELEKNKNIIIAFTIILILIIFSFIYYYLIEKNKKEKLQTAYQTEIRIAKKLHDELANEIYQTINFAETQDLSSPNVSEKLLENLDSIYTTTRNISRENNFIETGSLYTENLKEMISSFNSKTVNILINGLEEIDWKSISELKKITMYRVIQELMVNMKKHSQSSLVLISFKKQENSLILNYYDNGIGINFEKQIKKNGLQNIENRIVSINGSITFEENQNKGVKTSIIIPI